MKIEISRPWVGAAVGVVVAAAAVGVYYWTRGDDTAAASTQTASRLVSVSTGTIKQSVSTTGTLSPADVEDVSFGTSATVTGVSVTVGQKVTKGQVLGAIDPVSLDAALAQAKLTLANAKATLAATDDDTSDAQVAADTASVTSAKAAVADAKTARAKATLRSPITGVVAEVNVTKGASSAGGSASSASSGSSSGSGSSPSGGGGSTGSTTSTTSSSSSSSDFVVIGTTSWTVSATVDDTQIGLLAVGDQAQLTTDNVTGTVFGTVSSVSVLSSSSSGSASYPVTIAVTGTPSGLHDGASATVSIIYKQLTNVLTVPTLAVHTASGTSYVYVSSNGAKTRRTVTTGLSSGGTTQIKSGLTSGQQVYVDVQTQRTGTQDTTNQQQGGYGNFPGGGNGGPPGGGNFPVGGQGGNR